MVPILRPVVGSETDDPGVVTPDRLRPAPSSFHPSVSRGRGASSGGEPAPGRPLVQPAGPVAGLVQWPGQTDAALSTSSSRPAPHCLTAEPERIPERPTVPDRRVFEGTPPDDAGADRSICPGTLQTSADRRTAGLHAHCTSAPGTRKRPGPIDPGRLDRDELGGARSGLRGGRCGLGRDRSRGGRRDHHRGTGRRSRGVARDDRATD
jgi:hypothetical protein